MQAHWWAAVAGGCILALLMMAERRPIALLAVAGDGSIAVATYALINGSTAAAVAFAAGRASGWVWGI
jgi:hypothetical protein